MWTSFYPPTHTHNTRHVHSLFASVLRPKGAHVATPISCIPHTKPYTLNLRESREHLGLSGGSAREHQRR